MASENETVGGIVNDLRFGIQSIKGCSQFVTDRLFGDIDRIESAWRREKAELERKVADALTTGAFIAEASARKPRRNCDRFANADDAWDSWTKTYDPDKMGTPFGEFQDWLFAPVAEGGES